MSNDEKKQTLTKREIARRIAKKRGDLSQTTIMQIVSVACDLIIEELADGASVRLDDLAIIKVVDRKARKARNPRTGEEVDVPAKRALKINPIGRMGQALKGGD